MLLWVVLGCYITSDEKQQAYDRDGDGFLTQAMPNGTDCDDTNPNIHPGAFESCLDGIDSDCDTFSCPPRLEVSLESIAPHMSDLPGQLYGSYSALIDFTRDGILDLVVSAPLSNDSLGSVLVIPGPLSEGNQSTYGSSIMTIHSDEYMELHLDAVIDMDGDGFDELILTATRRDPLFPEESRNYHYLVPAYEPGLTVWTSQLSTSLTGSQWEDYVAEDQLDEADLDELVLGGVENVGDQNGDGLEDLLILSPHNRNGGQVFLLTGSITDNQLIYEANIQVAQSDSLENLGSFGGRGPDLNGDGLSEVIVGSSDYDLPIETSGVYYEDVGGVFVFEAPLQGNLWTTDADIQISGSYAESPIAEAFNIGDTDGDGYEELGAYIQSGAGDLAIFRDFQDSSPYLVQYSDVYIYGGFSSGLTSEFAESMVSYDVDGDERLDLLLSASTEPSLSGWEAVGLGATYLFYGPVSGVQSPDHAAMRWSAGSGDWVLAPPMVGLVDDDAYPDLLLPYVGDEDNDGRLYLISDAFGAL